MQCKCPTHILAFFAIRATRGLNDVSELWQYYANVKMHLIGFGKICHKKWHPRHDKILDILIYFCQINKLKEIKVGNETKNDNLFKKIFVRFYTNARF